MSSDEPSWYCTRCGTTTSRLPVGVVSCPSCGDLGLRANAKPPIRVGCPLECGWTGWDDGGVNDDLGRHKRLEHAGYPFVERALSLWQPWASLICMGAGKKPLKTIETRSWSTKHRGPVLICSTGRLPSRDEMNLLDGHDLQRFPPLGAALGVAHLVDCLPMVAIDEEDTDLTCVVIGEPGLWIDHQNEFRLTHLDDQSPYGDFAPGRWAWMLEDIVSFAEPIDVTGGRQLWRTDGRRNPNLQRDIERALAGHSGRQRGR